MIAAAHAYEDALVSGDGASGFFDDDVATSRFGPEGPQYDRRSVIALRAETAPKPVATWLHERVRPIGPDSVLHIAVLRRAGIVVQRTQLWVRSADQWRIAHAHVSEVGPR